MSEEKYPIYDDDGEWGLHWDFRQFLMLYSDLQNREEYDDSGRIDQDTWVTYRNLISRFAKRRQRVEPALRVEDVWEEYGTGPKGEDLWQKTTIVHKERPQHISQYWWDRNDIDEMSRLPLYADDIRPIKYRFFCRGLDESYKKYKFYENFIQKNLTT